jgi:hypothetical protein
MYRSHASGSTNNLSALVLDVIAADQFSFFVGFGVLIWLAI